MEIRTREMIRDSRKSFSRTCEGNGTIIREAERRLFPPPSLLGELKSFSKYITRTYRTYKSVGNVLTSKITNDYILKPSTAFENRSLGYLSSPEPPETAADKLLR